MSESRGTQAQTALLAGGGIAMLAVVGQLISLYSDGDLATPIGRFRAMAEGLGHFAPVLTASSLMLWGTWNSNSKEKRALVAGSVVLMIAICLAALPSLLPDARQLSSGVIPVEVSRFRGQVVRAFLYVIGTIVILGISLWKYLRRVPLFTP
jgi:hypothetical protein